MVVLVSLLCCKRSSPNTRLIQDGGEYGEVGPHPVALLPHAQNGLQEITLGSVRTEQIPSFAKPLTLVTPSHPLRLFAF